MSFLNELRILLIDARIALRETRADEDDDPLWNRLEKAIRDISTYVLPPPAANTKTTAQQVALAWQTVCRGVKLSHPELYDELAGKVMRLLDEKELVEPVTELLQLDAQVKKLQAGQKAFESRMAELGRKAGEAQAHLDQLYQALAAAVPQPLPAPDPQALALLRIETLATQPAGAARSAGGGRGGAAAPPAPVEGPVPTRAVLEAVAGGARPFSREQREWVVAECLALTGWQFTPLELIERGDPWLAQQLLAAPNPPG